MKFLVLYYADEMALAELPTAEMDRIVDQKTRAGAELWGQGKMVGGARLWPSATATRLSVRDGRCSAVDGPFTETMEVLGGFNLIECASKAEAVEWAKQHLTFESAVVEVRPVWERCLCHGSYSCSSLL
jgi:hypothetical protein